MVNREKIANSSKVLIVYCHPGKDSLNNAFKKAFIRGLKETNAKIRIQDLYKERFNPLLYDIEKSNKDKKTKEMKKNISWADRIVFITPLWWANIPAMLKGYFDRVFTEDFVFEYNKAGIPVGLIKDKKALIIGTCDTPVPILYLNGGILGFKSVIRGILKFSGIKKSRFKLFGSVLNSTEKKRKVWIKEVEKMGKKFAKPEGAFSKSMKRVKSFIKAVRFHLSSFIVVGILLGASIGFSISKSFNVEGFIIALAIGIFSHAAVSLSNEFADESIDDINKNRTMFSGGTGLLSKELITKETLKWGWIVSALLAIGLSAVSVFFLQYHWILMVCVAVGLLFGLGYSFPPLWLSHRGLGEIGAFITYGLPIILGGLVFQVDNLVVEKIIASPGVYLLAFPVSLSIFTFLSLTQIPDTEADKKDGKKSISVVFGPQNVLKLSVFMFIICSLAFFILSKMGLISLTYAVISSIFPVITALVILFNLNAYKEPTGMKMISIMGLGVNSAILCSVVPAIYFFSNPGQINLIK